MQATVDGKSLSEAFHCLQRALKVSQVMTVHVVVTNGLIEVRATDGTSFAIAIADAEVETPSEAIVSSIILKLRDYLDGSVSVGTSGADLVVKFKRTTVSLRMLSGAGVDCPCPRDGEWMHVNEEVLRAVQLCSTAALPGNLSPLSNVYVTDGQVIGTDGYRLIAVSVQFKPPWSFLIPSGIAARISAFGGDLWYLRDNWLVAMADNGIAAFPIQPKEVVEKYPNLDRFISLTQPTRAVIRAEMAKPVFYHAAKASAEDCIPLNVTLSPEGIALELRGMDYSSKEVVPVQEFSGQNVTFCINPSYVTLRSWTGELVIEAKDGRSPVIFRSGNEKLLIMPIWEDNPEGNE